MKTTLGPKSGMCSHSSFVLKIKKCLIFIEVHNDGGSTRLDWISFNSDDEKTTLKDSTNIGDKIVDGVLLVDKKGPNHQHSDF